MMYSIVGIVSIIVHIIINSDLISSRRKNSFPGEKYYILFLIFVIIYHLTDIGWGFLAEAKLASWLIADTSLYFLAMAASILFWGLFVYHYLDKDDNRNKIIIIVGFIIFFVQVVAVIVNTFANNLFIIDEECNYSISYMRYVTLALQIATFSLLGIYTFIVSLNLKGTQKRKHIFISICSLLMLIAIILQVYFPLLPLYSIGFLIVVSALHTFVIEDEMINQNIELEDAKHLVLIDPLTGVSSKHAYINLEMTVDNKIDNGLMDDFAMVVFDLNDLKLVNDTYGHEKGDEYIIESTRLINKMFPKCPLFRVGGDEFVVVLFNDEFVNKQALLYEFEKVIDENVKNGGMIVIASGLAIFDKENDTTILQVFTRADRMMYSRKREIKSIMHKLKEL